MQGRTFLSVPGTLPAFNSSAFGTTAPVYALESTGREWFIPINRSVRLVGHDSTANYYVEFGTASVQATTNSFLAIGGQPYIVHVGGAVTHVSFVSTGATVTANIGIGFGGMTEENVRRFVNTAAGPVTAIFTIEQAASIVGVQWSTDTVFSIGQAAHIMGLYHFTTST